MKTAREFFVREGTITREMTTKVYDHLVCEITPDTVYTWENMEDKMNRMNQIRRNAKGIQLRLRLIHRTVTETDEMQRSTVASLDE